ncbi:MAG: 16S rRNA (cytosine(967)-C(5))-methyltransferase RsmB [Betaproteobacteria bacterium]|nr:16S rRNA (cytosine(967)-C(5))-methyltransferase RsmB [Betaproteobacteria bacterium]
MEENQRLAAITLRFVFEGKNVDQALLMALKTTKNIQVNQGAVKSFVYGVLRFGWQLKHIVSQLCKSPPSPLIENLLLIAIFQLVYTTDEPFTVVSQAVNAVAKLENPALKGFINAVLRTFLRGKDKILLAAQQNEESHFNHPQWWITKIKAQYPSLWSDILGEAQQRAPLTLRVNVQRISVEDYLQELAHHNIEVAWHNKEAIVLTAPCSVDQLPLFTQGAVSVQDLSAQYAKEHMDLFAHARVLDACAAPGGKTCHLLEQNEPIDLLVLDKSEDRLKKIQDNIKRLRLTEPSLGIKPFSAQNTHEWWDKVPFDRILLDAPCTGSGIVRRHPDIKWLRRESDIRQLVLEQKELLRSLWPLLKSQGKLVYATCSIFKEETSLQIRDFLQEHKDATLINGASPEDGFIRPDSFHDGFYYAVCQKI